MPRRELSWDLRKATAPRNRCRRLKQMLFRYLPRLG